MSKFDSNLLLMHFVDQTFSPSKDKELWLAYAVLNNKYSAVVYWCVDTFHVEAIVDQEHKLILAQRHGGQAELSKWEGDFEWDKLSPLHSFNKHIDTLTTTEIVNAWMQVMGETKESNQAYVNNFKKGVS